MQSIKIKGDLKLLSGSYEEAIYLLEMALDLIPTPGRGDLDKFIEFEIETDNYSLRLEKNDGKFDSADIEELRKCVQRLHELKVTGVIRYDGELYGIIDKIKENVDKIGR